MEVELKSCPFCGEALMRVDSIARALDQEKGGRPVWEYHHPENDCILSRKRWSFDPVAALDDTFVANWNKREPAPSLLGEDKSRSLHNALIASQNDWVEPFTQPAPTDEALVEAVGRIIDPKIWDIHDDIAARRDDPGDCEWHQRWCADSKSDGGRWWLSLELARAVIPLAQAPLIAQLAERDAEVARLRAVLEQIGGKACIDSYWGIKPPPTREAKIARQALKETKP